MNIQQQDFQVIQQSVIKKFVKLNVLDFSYNILAELSGRAVQADVNVNADSDLRRNCNISLVIDDGSIDVSSGSPIWLDKYIQIYVGFESVYTGEIQWYNQGIYLINEPSWAYDGATNTLSFQGVDLMAKLTGLRNGQLEGVPTQIPQGSSVKDSIETTISDLGGFTQYIVSECENANGTIQDVPYDIQISQGGTVFDILKALRDILPNYQMYFDVDGVFRYEPIPSDYNAPVIFNDEILSGIIISENINTSFENVKNYIEVYGRTHDVSYFSTDTAFNVSGSTRTLSLTIDTLPSPIPDNTLIGFETPNTNIYSITVFKINDVTYPFVDSNSTSIATLEPNKYYVAQYQQSGNNFLFLGGLQASAIAIDDNEASAFDINKIGRIRQVLFGGEYDNIMSDELAQERANIELYWRCRLNDNISFSCIPIPFIDVNTVIEHNGKKYIIKSFSVEYGQINSMQVTAVSFYPYYTTLKFNQLISNGNFVGTTGWNATRGTITATNNILTYTLTQTGTGNQCRIYTPVVFNTSVIGHKYFAIATVKSSAQKYIRFASMGAQTISFPTTGEVLANTWTTLTSIVNVTAYNNNSFAIYLQNNNTNGDTLEVQNCMLIDLTAMYGEGKEPTTTQQVVSDCALIGHNLEVYQPTTTN